MSALAEELKKDIHYIEGMNSCMEYARQSAHLLNSITTIHGSLSIRYKGKMKKVSKLY